MMIKLTNLTNLSECSNIFTYFNHISPISPYNSTRARIKLACKVAHFNLLSSERSGLIK
jgi:hypothetical protein